LLSSTVTTNSTLWNVFGVSVGLASSRIIRFFDQIFKIFQRKGTLTTDIWPVVSRLPHYNAEFPQWRERPMTDHVPMSVLGSDNAVDLLTKLLMYDPDQRFACKSALQHPYFFE
jgi:serine/threonine protein kinase